jgi:hypothetical protein
MQVGKRKWWVLAPVLFAGAALLMGWVVMSLWNGVLVPALHVGALNFWQGLGLLVLSRLLFGGFRGGTWGGHRGGPWKEKWRHMSDDERLQMKQAWQPRQVPAKPLAQIFE